MATREDIEKVIAEMIRPRLAMDGGDCELVDYKENKVFIKLTGHCSGCPMAAMTLQFGIEQVIKEQYPEVEAVVPV